MLFCRKSGHTNLTFENWTALSLKQRVTRDRSGIDEHRDGLVGLSITRGMDDMYQVLRRGANTRCGASRTAPISGSVLLLTNFYLCTGCPVLQSFMGYLGLSEPAEKQDNIFQRLFWPSDHAGEADTLGQQGFWICAVVAIISLVALSVQRHWILALLSFAFFLLGGIGVREHSTPAAVFVALAYALNQALGLFLGQFPGFLAFVACVLLIANIRGTWIASQHKFSGDPDAFPERLNSTFRDKLVDQMPAKVWPRTKILFFVIAALYMLLTLFGTAAILVGSFTKR